jgi:hypothetical protein
VSKEVAGSAFRATHSRLEGTLRQRQRYRYGAYLKVRPEQGRKGSTPGTNRQEDRQVNQQVRPKTDHETGGRLLCCMFNDTAQSSLYFEVPKQGGY